MPISKTASLFLAALFLLPEALWAAGSVKNLEMTTPRSGHNATLLADGNVLLTGDKSVEVYEAEKEIFRPVGDLNVRRFQHTGTLLQNGMVLIAGGTNTPSAELYDPVTQVFRTIGPMTAVRSEHTATLLNDGTVLLMGGRPDSEAFSTTEIFDPATERFTPGPNLLVRRFHHAATLLPDGRVLVTGGVHSLSGAQKIQSAEFYDPRDRSMKPAPMMFSARTAHHAVLLADGSLFLSDPPEIYDPEKRGYPVLVRPAAPISDGAEAAVLPSGEIYLGSIFDPLSFTTRAGPRLSHQNPFLTYPITRMGMTRTALLNGKVLMTGGFLSGRNVYGPTSGAELYDPFEDGSLQNGRFVIDLFARIPETRRVSLGIPIKQNEKFGYFWFIHFTDDPRLPEVGGSPDNPEVLVKIVGPMPDGAYLLFHSGLTHLEYTLTVRDTVTGRSKTFTKPAGNFFAVGFSLESCAPFCGPTIISLSATARHGDSEPVQGLLIQAGGLSGFAFPDLTGDPENPEVFVKIITLPNPNSAYISDYVIFAAGLTDFEATITVRITREGAPSVEHQFVKPSWAYFADVLLP
jgi:hypothetical protein